MQNRAGTRLATSRNMLTHARLGAVVCALLLAPVTTQPAFAQQAISTEQAQIPDAQLDSLVAPIALYPDPLLAQVLAASTYPLEIVQLQQWLAQHGDLRDQALVDAVEKQDWDASVQAMAAMPEVVKRLADDIKWTTDLGNAFLGQQGGVMDAVQRMRMKARGMGNLKSSAQMKVETQVVESKTIIVIEQANPQMIYVPTYNPTVVYGAPVYPYPSIYYPPVGAVAAGMALSFGVGVAMGAAFHGGWGYNAGWGGGGHNNININTNNNYVRNSGNRTGGGGGAGGGSWQHNPQHRGGTPYGNQNTANKFGGTTRDASAAQRQNAARQQPSRQGGGGAGGGGAASTPARGGGGAGGGRGGGSATTQPARGGGGDRVGNHSSSAGGSRGGGNSAFGGGSGGSARQSSSRGGASSGGARGGGGGGGRGGGGRGGGRR